MAESGTRAEPSRAQSKGADPKLAPVAVGWFDALVSRYAWSPTEGAARCLESRYEVDEDEDHRAVSLSLHRTALQWTRRHFVPQLVRQPDIAAFFCFR